LFDGFGRRFGVNDLLWTNEMRIWFLGEHLVKMPPVHAIEQRHRRLRQGLKLSISAGGLA
jgi:hypothetical protein